VIAVHDNGGEDVVNGGGNFAGDAATADAPLTQVSSGHWGGGRQWGVHASGYMQVASVSSVTPTFTTKSPGVYATVAVEFLSDGPVIPEPTTFALAALGLLGLMGLRRRRNR
jgi:hypothetical protein